MQAKRRVSALRCREPLASIASCLRWVRFFVAQAGQNGDPSFATAGHLANVGTNGFRSLWGADVHALTRSAIGTARFNGVAAHQAIVNALNGTVSFAA
jgi:hypothetical protein